MRRNTIRWCAGGLCGNVIGGNPIVISQGSYDQSSSGTIDATDLGLVKSQSGTTLP